MLEPGHLSPDRAARLLTAAAFAYYRCSESVISDAENDALAVFVAHNWDYLSPEVQERLDSADAIRATTHHIWMTSKDYFGAIDWAYSLGITLAAPPFVAEAEQDTPSGKVGLMGIGG